MKFDFYYFRELAKRAYTEVVPKEIPPWRRYERGGAWAEYPVDEVLAIFRYYFTLFEEATGKPHLPLNRAQIARIIELMPFDESKGEAQGGADFEPHEYRAMIKKHFQAQCRDSNRLITQFFANGTRRACLDEVEWL